MVDRDPYVISTSDIFPKYIRLLFIRYQFITVTVQELREGPSQPISDAAGVQRPEKL